MKSYLPFLNLIEKEKQKMVDLLIAWANISSGSTDLLGLSRMNEAVKQAFICLHGSLKEVDLHPNKIVGPDGRLMEQQLGKVLIFSKRPEAPIQILLSGHLDTVYSQEFTRVERIDTNTLKGPAVADMKGGLVIMLKALEVLERTPFCQKIGWEVLLNPDEEIGSPGSSILLDRYAKGKALGLVFEPAFADGSLVSSRKGGANFTFVCRGLAAHSGRDFHKGKNAIFAIAKVLSKIQELKSSDSETTINVGYIHGGGPVNIVPDFTLCKLNARSFVQNEIDKLKNEFHNIVEKERQGTEITIYQESSRPAKVFDKKTETLYSRLKECAEQLDIPLNWKPSGGASDGNNLAASGLTTLDTLGVIGGNLHTQEEYMVIDSLKERASLVALFLMKLATNEIEI